MTQRKAQVRGNRKPKLVCTHCGDPVVNNPDGRGWREFLHQDDSKLYDHRPSVEPQEPEIPIEGDSDEE